MHIVLLAAGKLKHAGLRDLVDDYLKRVRRYARVQHVEVKDGELLEAFQRIRTSSQSRTRAVAMEVTGAAWSSARFAKFIGDSERDAVQSLLFVIGGADGLPAAITDTTDRQLSLSPMTLPHRLARLVLAEQMYRAFTILRNEPYPR